MKIIFAGTPDFAAQHLAALLTTSHDVVAVFTQPDRPAGRGNKITASPVKQLALHHRIPLFQPASLRTAEPQQHIADLAADVMVVVAYGLILPHEVLNLPRLGCINVHGSLLPRWRGAAPIQRALWAGDAETGITLMQMDAGLDSGDILYQVSCPIEATDTSASLYQKLATIGPQALQSILPLLSEGLLNATPQDPTLATYAKKLNKEEAKLDWSLSAIQLERCIRAFNPWPVSYFVLHGEPCKVWEATVIHDVCSVPAGTIIDTNKYGIQVATHDGIINMTVLQPAGKKAMSAQQLLNSRRDWFQIGRPLN